MWFAEEAQGGGLSDIWWQKVSATLVGLKPLCVVSTVYIKSGRELRVVDFVQSLDSL